MGFARDCQKAVIDGSRWVSQIIINQNFILLQFIYSCVKKVIKVWLVFN